MSSHFELWLTNDAGTRIADLGGAASLTKALRFSATRIVNGIGELVVDVPGTFDQSLLRRDNMIQVWHAPAGGALRMFRPYFLRKWEYTLAPDTGETLQLTGLCVNDLLRRRVIAAALDRGGVADMNFEADDELRALVRYAMMTSYDVIDRISYSRNWEHLTVEVDTSTAASVDISDMSFEPLLTADGGGKLPKICKKCDDSLYFDIVPLSITATDIELIFRAYVGQPGSDRTNSALVFAPENGNMTDVSLVMDYTGEYNDIYTGKIGKMAGQQITEDADMDAVRASAWNRCESYTEDPADANDIRLESVNERLTGTIVQTGKCIFGRDWDWGDRVPVKYRTFQKDALITAVTFQVDERGAETVSARIDTE